MTDTRKILKAWRAANGKPADQFPIRRDWTGSKAVFDRFTGEAIESVQNIVTVWWRNHSQKSEGQS